jgi:16S rRNA (adenine1518-N6/adenine1519-N6)-dimethyltransferase
MKKVRPKKKLGQHFLTDLNIAQKIADLLQFEQYQNLLEIGPGTGVLTQFLVSKTTALHLVEIDEESILFLEKTYTEEQLNLIKGDFLKLDLNSIFGSDDFAIIGNFPYNISSQIVFKVLENKSQIPFFAGMFQKEVAERICEPPGSKKYGILSVLAQLYYETEYLFTVPPGVFNPPPKVDSAVIQMTRKKEFNLGCNEALLKKIVKLSFQQRRKTLRNSLKTLNLPDNLREDSIFDLRPEKLSGDDFIQLTKRIDYGDISN